MNARNLLESLGEKLLLKKVLTQPYGDWPGGPATVTEINPDPEAPEIVFRVRHESAPDPESKVDVLWNIGVLEHEDVKLL